MPLTQIYFKNIFNLKRAYQKRHILRLLMDLRLSEFLLNTFACTGGPSLTSIQKVFFISEKLFFIRFEANVMFIAILWAVQPN